MRRLIILVVGITLFSEFTPVVRAQSSGQPGQLSNSPTSRILSPAEIEALRARISQCWVPPPDIDASSTLYVVLRFQLKPDGTMTRDPTVVELKGEPSTLGPALAESAKNTLLRCQPFTMLLPEHYDLWKDLEIKFDPREMLRGRALSR
jgi:hypothetical protein